MTSVIGLIRDAILANVRDDIIWKHFVRYDWNVNKPGHCYACVELDWWEV